MLYFLLSGSFLSIPNTYLLGWTTTTSLECNGSPMTTLQMLSPHPVPASRSLANRYRRITTFLTLKTLSRPRSITDSNDVNHSTAEMQLAHNFQSSETCAPLDTR